MARVQRGSRLMADFLLELLSEEIPARMQARARNDLAADVRRGACSEAGLAHGAIAAFSTPRRLALIVARCRRRNRGGERGGEGPAHQRASRRRSTASCARPASPRTSSRIATGSGSRASTSRGGRRPRSLPKRSARSSPTFPGPSRCAGATATLRWVRPLHSIVALLGEDIVPVEVAGIASGATTLGHRFHHPGADHHRRRAATMSRNLRACHVIVDQDEREALIRDGAAKAAERSRASR